MRVVSLSLGGDPVEPLAGNPVDAAVIAAVLLGMPGLTIASGMMTNDALCALFTTATLVRLLAPPSTTLPSALRFLPT